MTLQQYMDEMADDVLENDDLRIIKLKEKLLQEGKEQVLIDAMGNRKKLNALYEQYGIE